jgi:anti-sigma B factor antagonist
MEAHEHIDADGLHIIALHGEVDLHHASELRSLLSTHADALRRALLLDFSGVTYIDSSGLATIIEYVQKAMDYQGAFALGGVSDRLRAIFDLARLGEVFTIRATVAEAKAAIVA